MIEKKYNTTFQHFDTPNPLGIKVGYTNIQAQVALPGAREGALRGAQQARSYILECGGGGDLINNHKTPSQWIEHSVLTC